MASILQDFKKFLMRGNLIELAVAFVMGAVFAALVKAFVADLITPIIGAIFGSHNAFGDLTFTLTGSVFSYGDFIDNAIAFVATGFAIFFFVVKPYDRYQSRKVRDDPTVKECPECTSEIPIKARRCPECTAVLTATA